MKSTKNKIVNSDLKKSLKDMVDDVFRKDLRGKAMKLLLSARKEHICDFLYYYHSDQGNICCLVLDSIADEHRKFGTLPKGIGNEFGFDDWDDRENQ